VKSDQRRVALLRSLDQQLRDGPLAEVSIADISRQAGVTRSAFYFYFENKAAAVAALMDEMYENAFAAADPVVAGGTVPERVSAAIRALFGTWERQRHLYRAMLDARAASQAVRDKWDAARESFVPLIAEFIRSERADGRAPGGPEPELLASILLDVNDRAMERVVTRGPFTPQQETDALIAIWLRVIYRTDQP
jgi:AcrR family transcriptional regulator